MYTFDEKQLPSNMQFYNIKCLEMEKFKFKQLTGISSSISNKHLGAMVSALGEVLKDFDVNDLTQGDFYYLLAYQRINSYSKPIYCHWNCRNTVFRDVEKNSVYSSKDIEKFVDDWNNASSEEKESLTDPNMIKIVEQECGHSNSLPVVWDDVQTVHLPNDLELDSRLDIPRARTLADSIIMRSDPELGNIVPAAQWIKDGNNLAEKIEVLKSQNDLDLFETALLAQNTIEHGIRNRVHKECEACGGGANHIFEITPSIFFLV